MSGKRIHSDEVKLEIVTKYLEGNLSLKTLAKEYCVCKSDIQKWRNSYLEHGLEGICHTTRTYTGDFKVAVVEYMHNTGASQRQTAAHFNIASHPTEYSVASEPLNLLQRAAHSE